MSFLNYSSPYLSIVLDVLAKYLQVDISYILSALFVFMALSTTFRLSIFDTISSFFVSSIEIRMDDEVFNQVMYWVSKQEFSQKASRTVAITQFRNLQWFSEAASMEEEDDGNPNEDFDTEWKKRRCRSKVNPILLTPAEGETWFWYKGRHLIRLRRFRVGRDAALPWERLTLMCFGRSNAILKELIEEAQQLYSARDGNKTVIYRPVQVGPESDWRRCGLLYPRKLESVIIPGDLKWDLLERLKQFLSQKTRLEYRQRGFPYRIGLMFFGPPGTGKTSLCFALAGELQLPIYLLSLGTSTMTDQSLVTLFNKLPKECIVLLEDVDAAGITTRRVSMAQPRDPDSPSAHAVDRAPSEKLGGITLSGLLNVIDGVSAPEGRILVMTSNHIENLDPALTRPGRIDYSIKLDYADRDIVREFFMAMYKPLDPQGEDLDHLKTLAERFADTIPNKQVTPAELQTYLLYYKDSPQLAVENAFSWPHLSFSSEDEGPRYG